MAAVVAPGLGDVQGLDPRNEGRQFTAVEEKTTTRFLVAFEVGLGGDHHADHAVLGEMVDE